MSKFSISAAHRITGKSRTTLTKHISEGKLSVSTDNEGNKLIDASELIRVYGDACDFSKEEGGPVPAKTSPAAPGGQGDPLLEKEQQERTRERQQYEARIEHLETALKLAQEGHNRATLLLEHQSKSPEGISQQLKTLEQRMVAAEEKSQQQVLLVKKRARAVIQKYKLQIEQEKKKSFWEKIIGG